MYYLWTACFIILWAGSWILTLFGLPGNWLILITGVIFAYLFPVDVAGAGLSWTVVACLGGLAVLGEVIESISSAMGIAKGGSKLGAFFAVVGSFVGSMCGTILALPIPVVGPIFGILLGGSLGALGGAMLGEIWLGRTTGESLRLGKIAFWGRLFGSIAKITIGSIMLAVATVAALF